MSRDSSHVYAEGRCQPYNDGGLMRGVQNSSTIADVSLLSRELALLRESVGVVKDSQK